MEWVHVVLDNDEESEFKEELNQLDEIPKVYKKYPELKSRVTLIVSVIVRELYVKKMENLFCQKALQGSGREH